MATPFLDSLTRALEKKEFTNLYIYEILIDDYLKSTDSYRGLSRSMSGLPIFHRW